MFFYIKAQEIKHDHHVLQLIFFLIFNALQVHHDILVTTALK